MVDNSDQLASTHHATQIGVVRESHPGRLLWCRGHYSQ